MAEENPFTQKAKENIEAANIERKVDETFSKSLKTQKGELIFLDGELKRLSPGINALPNQLFIGVSNKTRLETPIFDKNGNPVIKDGKQLTSSKIDVNNFFIDRTGEAVFGLYFEDDNFESLLREKGFTLKGDTIDLRVPNFKEIRRALVKLQSLDKRPQLVLDIKQQLKRFVYLPSEREYSLSATWILGTYFCQLFPNYPYLHLWGNRGSGKTRHASAIHALAYRPVFGVDSSVSPLFRYIDSTSGTLIIDEEEKLGKRAKVTDERIEALTSILNAGYSKGATVLRSSEKSGKKKTFEPVLFSVYCPKVICNIEGITQETLKDRTIRLIMIRANGGRFADARDAKILGELKPLNYACLASLLQYWEDVKAEFETSEAEIKQGAKYEHLKDREADLWLPLLTIAKLFGSPEDLENIVLASKEHAENKADSDTEETDTALVLRSCLEVLAENESKKVLLREIAGKAKELKAEKEDSDISGFGWITNKFIGRELERIGLYPKNKRSFGHNHQAQILLIKKELFETATRYNIDLGQKPSQAKPAGLVSFSENNQKTTALKGWKGTPQELEERLTKDFGTASKKLIEVWLSKGTIIRHNNDLWEVV